MGEHRAEVEDFCGAGITVDSALTVSGEARIHERNGLFYFQGHSASRETITYQGMTATLPGRLLEKDLKVTENADGTFSVLVLLTGPFRIVSHTGKVIGKDDGQTRLMLHLAADGSFISSERVFGSTGTNDDLCATLLENWGL